MSEIIDVEARPVPEALPERVIVLQTEIKALHRQYREMSVSYAVEIGRRLCEAKELLPHGAWGAWLRDNVEFSQRTAGDLMRMFEEYGADQQGLLGPEVKSQAIADLSVTQAVRLLSLPEDEREELAREVADQGMSTRELAQAIRERDEARKRAEEAEADRDNWKQDAETTRKKAEQDEADLTKQAEDAEKSFFEAKKKADALERQLKETQKATPAAASAEEILKATPELRRQLDEAREEAERLRKELKASDAAVAEFKVYFDGIQQQAAKMMKLLDRMEAEKAGKLRTAARAVLGQLLEELAETDEDGKEEAAEE